MPNAQSLSAKELDYLKEMTNIGSGHAASALSQLLLCRIDIRIPRLYVAAAKDVTAVLNAGGSRVACVQMDLLGDVRGHVFVVIPESEKVPITRIAEKANLGAARKGLIDISVLEEVANIITGAYLTAIHDFCKLNIYHSVPATVTDVLQAAIDETLAEMSRRSGIILVIESELDVLGEGEFVSVRGRVRTFHFVFLLSESLGALVDSMRSALPE